MKKVLALIIFLFSFSFLYASDFFQLTFGANISFEKIDIKDTDTTKDIVKNLICVCFSSMFRWDTLEICL